MLPTTSLTSPLWVDERRQQVLVAVVLDAVPTRDLSIPVINRDPGRIEVATTQLTFTVHDWDQPHLILITGLPSAASRCCTA